LLGRQLFEHPCQIDLRDLRVPLLAIYLEADVENQEVDEGVVNFDTRILALCFYRVFLLLVSVLDELAHLFAQGIKKYAFSCYKLKALSLR
jgi:hypothetical protein